MGSALRGVRRSHLLWLATLFVLLATAVPWSGGAQPADACAFLRTPHTYEADRARARYLETMNAASQNLLFPGDPYFGVPPVETGISANRSGGSTRVPAVLIKAISWVESGLTMASRSVAFESAGPALVSFDCGHGLMQVTTGMTVPLGTNGQPTERQIGVATSYVHNIARGTAMLVDKWNQAPEQRPISGIDTNSDPNLIENWYFALWGYNGFTGPASNQSNHPADPKFGSWPRTSYRCDGTQSRGRYPYQELVYGCVASPPAASGGAPYWSPVGVTLPNLQQPSFFRPLSVSNFVYPYSKMHIPTPQPAHFDATPSVPSDFRERVFGAPALSVDTSTVSLSLEQPGGASATVRVSNAGTGVLSWSAEPSANWIIVDPPAGGIPGRDLPCNGGSCSAAGELTISVNPVLLPDASASGTVRITSPSAPGSERIVRVTVDADFEIAAPGTSRAY